MNAHVRKYAAGEFAKQSQDLLNELAKAMLCLTDKQRKGEYDVSLGRGDQRSGVKGARFEQILLASKVVDQAALDKARNFAKAIGVEMRDALVQQKLARPEAVLPAYAESIGLAVSSIWPTCRSTRAWWRTCRPMLARQHSCVPVLIDNKQLLMASPNPLDPDVEEELRLRFNMPIRSVLCTPANVNEVIAKYFPRDAAVPIQRQRCQSLRWPTLQRRHSPRCRPLPQPAGPFTPEKAKQRRDLTIVAFNLGGMVSIFAMEMFTAPGGCSR